MGGVDVMDWPPGSYCSTIKGKNIVLSINSKDIECHSFCCMATALCSQPTATAFVSFRVLAQSTSFKFSDFLH